MESIRLDTLTMQQFGLSPEEANGLIMAGRIWIGHVPADKPGMSVAADTVLTLVEKAKKYASRSGYKLAKALQVFHQPVEGLTVCDIGASNGGFTDCLLQNGAAHVFSVDVAYGILAWELRNDPRVTVLERTNARRLTVEQLGTVCDAVTVDVSFISLAKIYPAIRQILKPDGVCICLIKPQFEAQQRQLGKNGVLKDPADLPPLLNRLFDSAAENGLFVQDLTVSPIHGTNGNVEYLARFTGAAPLSSDEREALIAQALTQQPDDQT
ncbi:MAG: TlyA family RNA methyltransferase [Clostridia bacterium]|nr:TlyA family RNA methyltransferase [Clostridia bacterium]